MSGAHLNASVSRLCYCCIIWLTHTELVISADKTLKISIYLSTQRKPDSIVHQWFVSVSLIKRLKAADSDASFLL